MEIDLSNTGAADELCYEALAHENRRYVLTALCESETPLSLTELAVELVDERSDVVEVGVDRTAVERQKIELYHRHLPKLDDSGLVDFDVDRRLVRLAAEFDGADDTSELLAA